MAPVFADRCATLAEAWRWWAQVLSAIDDPAWRRATRLEGWDVAALVAHHSLLVRGLPLLASRPIEGEPQTATAADMLRRFNAPGGAATEGAGMVAEMARQQAASMPPATLLRVFSDDAPRTVEAVQATGPVVVDYFGNGTFPLAEAVSIAILEAVVHGLDLADALGAEVVGQSLPAAAVGATVELLASLADPIAFVESATGRADNKVLPVLR